MKKNSFISILFTSIFIFSSCSGNTSKSLWDRTFKSTGKTYINWDDKVSNTNKSNYQFLKENFNNSNIDFTKSGYVFYYDGKELVNDFNDLNIYFEFPIDNFSNFKSCLDSWWENDKDIIDEFTSFYGLKKNIDKIKFIIKSDKDTNQSSRGKLLMEFVDYNNKISYDEYYAFDDSSSKDGSELTLCKEIGEVITPVGYAIVARYSKRIDFIQVRSGYDDDSAVEFRIVLKEENEGVKSFSFYNNIVIKEYSSSLPAWAIVLISIGGVIIISVPTTIIIIKKRKKVKKV